MSEDDTKPAPDPRWRGRMGLLGCLGICAVPVIAGQVQALLSPLVIFTLAFVTAANMLLLR